MTKQPRRNRSSVTDANFPLSSNPLVLVQETLSKLTPSPAAEHLRAHIFSKFQSPDTAPAKVRIQRALNKWLACERDNEATNVRLMNIDPEYNILPRVSFERFIEAVRFYVVGVLGEVVPHQVLHGAFSGGASTSRRRNVAHPALKYIGEAHVTQDAFEIASQVIGESPLWRENTELKVVEGNVFFTVPKTSEIDRCCCKEPDLNMYLQKGAGNYIRQRLRAFGIDLNDQSRNQALAWSGSVGSGLATLDLSSASDSISRIFVSLVLPDMWFSYLDMIRSPVTLLPSGEVHKLEMFSSMGNGFTFELESLLFWSVCRAVAHFTRTPGIISVYGDDLIVPSEIADYIVFSLGVLGFSVNTDKSFIDGGFRESCGGHFINGLDITPFYVRKPVSHLIDLIHLCNQIRKWAGLNGDKILDPEVEDLWFALADMVPRRFWGGHDLEDKTRLVSVWQPPKPRKLATVTSRKRTGLGGYLLWLDGSHRESPMVGGIEIRSTSSWDDTPYCFDLRDLRWEGGASSGHCSERVVVTDKPQYREVSVDWHYTVTTGWFSKEAILPISASL